MTNTKLSRLFISACDSKTDWMKDWFCENFYKHNPDANLHMYNFDKSFTNSYGWFKKPEAMADALRKADSICWLDIDCEILGNIESIWNHVQPNKLCMVEDKPWSAREGVQWHNSGVVAMLRTPSILNEWRSACLRTKYNGDQEVLHALLIHPLKRLTHIQTLPNKYNVLRLQHIDKTVPKDPLIYHWTGYKGKDHIKDLING